MAGPIRISILADAAQAIQASNRFRETVEEDTRRVVTGFADMKLEGPLGTAQAGFDRADTMAMGFRDTLTGVQDSMRGFAALTTSTEEATARVRDAQAAYNDTVKQYGKDSAQAADAQAELTAAQLAMSQQQGPLIDKLVLMGMGVGDLASGFANFIVPMAALVTTMNGLSLATARATVAAAGQKVAMVAGTVATGAMTAAQWLLNAALTANPIGIVVVAVAALVAGLVVAYRRSETFRRVVDGAFRAVVHAAQSVVKSFDSIVTKVKSIPGRIKSAFGNARGILSGVGRAVIDGFTSALRSGFTRVKNTLSNLTSLLPDWKGPASRDRTLLVKNGKLVIGGFIAGLRSKYGDVRKSLRDFTRGIANQKDAKVVGDALRRGIQALKTRIDAQKKVVADLVKARSDYAKTIAGGLRGGGLTSIDLIYQDTSFQKNALVDGLKSRLQAIRDFQANLRALTKKGLSKSLIRQIADSGLETGSEYLTALQGASPSLIREINSLNRAINSASSGTGSMVANDIYGARIASERRKLPPQEMILKLDGARSRSGAGALIAALLEEESRKSGGLRIKLRSA